MQGNQLLQLRDLSRNKLQRLASRSRGKLKKRLASGKLLGGFFVIKMKNKPKFMPNFVWHFLIKLILNVEKDV